MHKAMYFTETAIRVEAMYAELFGTQAAKESELRAHGIGTPGRHMQRAGAMRCFLHLIQPGIYIGMDVCMSTSRIEK